MARKKTNRPSDPGDELQPVREPEPAPEPSPHPPVYFRDRMNPAFGNFELRERGPAAAMRLPRFLELGGDDTAALEAQAQRSLEAVGNILRRMQRDQREIDALRTETRAILARLAA